MLLEIDDLTVGYPMPDGSDTQVLHGVNVRVDDGETVGLVGESGSGKSTTARSALRLLPRGATLGGVVRSCGVDVFEADDARLRALRAGQIAFIHQDPRASLNPVRTIGDLVTERLVFGLGQDKKTATKKAVDLMRSVGLRDPETLLRRAPHQLSGGMLQRIVIAGCLSADPTLLIADEATSALDVTTQAEVLALIREQQIARGLGMLFITHDLRLAAAYCDRVYVLRSGEVIEELTGGDIFEEATQPYTQELLAATPTLPPIGKEMST